MTSGDVLSERTAQVRGVYSDGPWGQVHFSAVGDKSGPTVVLFHESPLSSQVFRPALRAAPSWLTAIAADTPGYGSSDPAPSAANELPEYSAALLTAIDGLGVGRFVAVGVHTGAAIALEVSRQAGAERVPGMVLSGLPMYTDTDRERHLAEWSPPISPRADGSQFAWAIERYERIWGPSVPTGLLHQAVTEVARCLERYHWAYNACFRYDARPALHELLPEYPILLLNAEFDLLANVDAWVQEIIPTSRLKIMSGLHGQPHQRRPEEYIQAVAAFAEEVWPAAE